MATIVQHEMNASEVELAVVRMIDPRRCLIVPRVSWMFPWESDLIQVSNSGYLTEYEIKVSIADMRREQAKMRWQKHENPHPLSSLGQFPRRIRRYYLAVPEEIEAQAKTELDKYPCPGAGLVVVSMRLGGGGTEQPFAEVVKAAKTNRLAERVTLEERYSTGAVGHAEILGPCSQAEKIKS